MVIQYVTLDWGLGGKAKVQFDRQLKRTDLGIFFPAKSLCSESKGGNKCPEHKYYGRARLGWKDAMGLWMSFLDLLILYYARKSIIIHFFLSCQKNSQFSSAILYPKAYSTMPHQCGF